MPVSNFDPPCHLFCRLHKFLTILSTSLLLHLSCPFYHSFIRPLYFILPHSIFLFSSLASSCHSPGRPNRMYWGLNWNLRGDETSSTLPPCCYDVGTIVCLSPFYFLFSIFFLLSFFNVPFLFFFTFLFIFSIHLSFKYISLSLCHCCLFLYLTNSSLKATVTSFAMLAHLKKNIFRNRGLPECPVFH